MASRDSTTSPNTPRLTPTRKAIKVKVTEELIASSKRENSSHCMIAEAITLADPTVNHVSVDISTIRLSDRKKRARYMYLTPEIARRKLLRFDQGADIVPFEFLLRAPAQVVPLKNPSETTRAKDKQRKKAKRERTRIVHAHGNGPSSRSIPSRVGGQLPPLAALGMTRKFGLRITSGGKHIPIPSDDGTGALTADN